MSRYFFNRIDGGIDPDTEGLEFADVEEAKSEAIVFASDTLKDVRFGFCDGGKLRIEVRDETNNLVFKITVTAVATFV